MSITEEPPWKSIVAEPKLRRWTADEYHQVSELGLFKGERVELIDGAILQMSPHGAQHTLAIHLVQKRLDDVFKEGHWVRNQSPLALGPNSEPEPDVAVVSGSGRDYAHRHPSTAILVVEVSDTTLASDRTRKASLYASAKIPEYWIVNLTDRTLEVHRRPIEDSAAELGWRYGEIVSRAPNDVVSPLSRAEATVAVKDLMP